jgi:trigger factor
VAVCEKVDLEFPESVVKYELDAAVEGFSQQLAQQGMNLEQYFKMSGITREKMIDEMRPDVIARVKEGTIIQEMMAVEKIEVLDEDLDKKFEEFAKLYGMELDVIKNVLGQNTDQMKNEIKIEKLFSIITK